VISLFTEATIRARIWFYELALSQIDPLHADVPEIVRTLCALNDNLDELRGQP
jgi:hypothetical protein